MSRKFKLNNDIHDNGVKLYKKRTITLEEGVTVLVGCNGIGKTTLLDQLQTQLKKENIPCFSFNNLTEGGSHAATAAFYDHDITFAATSMTSSEGENIVLNMTYIARTLGHFITTGESMKRGDELIRAFAKVAFSNGAKPPQSNERWILLDAIDSGLSVDNIVDIKEYLFKTILQHKGDKEVYIVVSANEYEMARGEQCFDVYQGKYRTFKTYESYRKFILKTREIKDQRVSQ